MSLRTAHLARLGEERVRERDNLMYAKLFEEGWTLTSPPAKTPRTPPAGRVDPPT